MKPSFVSPRPIILGAALAALLFCAGCGQKGALFMPVIPPDPLAPQPTAAEIAAKAKNAQGINNNKRTRMPDAGELNTVSKASVRTDLPGSSAADNGRNPPTSYGAPEVAPAAPLDVTPAAMSLPDPAATPLPTEK